MGLTLVGSGIKLNIFQNLKVDISTKLKHWIRTLEIPILREAEFKVSPKTCILNGSDESMEKYINSNLGGNLEKGIDLLLKINSNKYIIGEAKFITTSGGTQTNQLGVALELTGKKIKNATTIAILDGAVWFDNSYKQKIIQKEKPIMSALLLKEFINSQA